MNERAIVFGCQGEELLGILHGGCLEAKVGVLVIVGGPQYRVGSHRQFVLLARALASAGIPVFRFDYRGMGDASGDLRSFERVGNDIRAAIDSFMEVTPGLAQVVLWGLCDAASAAIDYAWRDDRVAGMVLLNPWVRTEEGLAKAYLKHYYLQRVCSLEFWSKVLRGRVDPLASLRSLLSMFKSVASRHGGPSQNGGVNSVACVRFDDTQLAPGQPLPARMAEGWKRFAGSVLLFLSGDDLTAAEFSNAVSVSSDWKGLLDRDNVLVQRIQGANHTFSRSDWRASVEAETVAWVLALQQTGFAGSIKASCD